MYVIVNIAGDPTSWWTESFTDANSLVGELALGAVNVPVVFPVKGNLLISRLATVSSIGVLPPHSWIPSDLTAPTGLLYLPSPAGMSAAGLGYTLPVGTNLDQLANEITSAMNDLGTVTTSVTGSVTESLTGEGAVRLNGRSLTFAVVCPPSAPPVS